MVENSWSDAAHALHYLGRAEDLPHRGEGEAELLEQLPERTERVLDLGCGDGRLMALVRACRVGVRGIALDFSETMLARASARFAGVGEVEVREHDLDLPLPELGSFDAVVSSFAIHHLVDRRKRSLYAEVYELLRPGGAFLNLEHVASPSVRVHRRFMTGVGVDPDEEDPSNHLSPVEAQLAWLVAAGFEEVDCHWKWRELALLGGVRPEP